MSPVPVRRLLPVERRSNPVSAFNAFVNSITAFSSTRSHSMYGWTMGGVGNEAILHRLDLPNTWRRFRERQSVSSDAGYLFTWLSKLTATQNKACRMRY
jgi:hypothetical protein